MEHIYVFITDRQLKGAYGRKRNIHICPRNAADNTPSLIQTLHLLTHCIWEEKSKSNKDFFKMGLATNANLDMCTKDGGLSTRKPYAFSFSGAGIWAVLCKGFTKIQALAILYSALP